MTTFEIGEALGIVAADVIVEQLLEYLKANVTRGSNEEKEVCLGFLSSLELAVKELGVIVNG